jgi:hypothetical protein
MELQLESISLKIKTMVTVDAGTDWHIEKLSDATLDRDRWRDLLMIDHFEAIKHGLIFL